MISIDITFNHAYRQSKYIYLKSEFDDFILNKLYIET